MWYPAEDFSFTRDLKPHWLEIKQELADVDPSVFRPWGQVSMYNRPGGWQYVALYADKMYPELQEQVALNRQHFPRTAELLRDVPGLHSAGFSALLPHTEIAVHTGEERGCIRGHFGIVVPEGAGMQVLGEERVCPDGDWVVFDDTYLHAAWNRSDTIRVHLIVDVLRASYGLPDRPVL